MSTAQDLYLVSQDVPGERPVEQGDLSLALAGAELIDLLGARALTLEGERVVPGPPLALGDRLLDEAEAALARQEPYETVEDWLWRRGLRLASAYREALTDEGRRGGWHRRRAAHREPAAADSEAQARRHACDRWSSHDPVLGALAAAVGIEEQEPDDEDLTDDATVTVLAAVNNAVTELEAVRQRRRIENAAFDNIWRAL
ncbi:GPP34 family phosphoprotein [Streptomyces sp. NK08204]|uniref:GPP34 family phosphoprotein n=1 Tax=Streptomyces sp. NK08204 TaxID=2873260 RepID=UPI001CED7217|nr:GPP34 family phosphoprotein [Streptomyces sp. NK08204]